MTGSRHSLDLKKSCVNSLADVYCHSILICHWDLCCHSIPADENSLHLKKACVTQLSQLPSLSSRNQWVAHNVLEYGGANDLFHHKEANVEYIWQPCLLYRHGSFIYLPKLFESISPRMSASSGHISNQRLVDFETETQSHRQKDISRYELVWMLWSRTVVLLSFNPHLSLELSLSHIVGIVVAWQDDLLLGMCQC